MIPSLLQRFEALSAPLDLGFDATSGGATQKLLSRAFVMLHLISEAYAAQVALGLAFDLGWKTALIAGTPREPLLEHLHPRSHTAAEWILSFLVEEHLLIREGELYRLGSLAPQAREKLREAAEAEAPGHLHNLDLLDALRAQILPFFTEGRRGEELLFGLKIFPLWIDYFRNENLLYRANNLFALEALRPALEPGCRLLELGGGVGSFAQLLAGEADLASRLAEYRFTDLAPAFLRRAQRELPDQWPNLPFRFSSLDLNRPLDAQGLEGETFDAILGVNVLHVAVDLPSTLRDLRAHLRPGGRLVLGECLKPDLVRPIYLEFFFEFMQSFREVNLDPVLRPTHGFLTPEHWVALLKDAGFREVHEVPRVRPLMEQYEAFNVGAFAGIA